MIITAGIYKGRKVTVPDESIVRPTLSKAREGIFNTLFSITEFEGKTFLDMFSGSGIMGLEALSRGFGEVLAVEKSPKVARIIKENYRTLKLEPNLVVADSLKLKTDKKFDVIYIDPPYASRIYEQTLEKIKKDGLLKEGGIVVLEHTEEIGWQKFAFKLLRQKNYSKKSVTFLTSC